MPPFPDLPDPLRGSVARLRPVAERDIPEVLIAHQDDPLLHLRLGLERPPSGAELGRQIEVAPAVRGAGAGVLLTILAEDSDDCAGELDVHAVDWEHRRADLRVWVVPARRGRGLASDALRVGGRWLLRACGLERVQLMADPANHPMRRAARAAGFHEEGVLRGYVREGGHRAAVVVLGLVTADLGPVEEP